MQRFDAGDEVGAELGPELGAELGAYLRLLWNVAPALQWPAGAGGDPARPGEPEPEAASAPPFLSNLGLHLPARAPPRPPGVSARHWYRAAAAHAAAHLVYPHEPHDAAHLKPITRALVGLLEDARVEWLACRELPGLRALWLPFHTATAGEGEGFEALLCRLARGLLDPGHRDPHPWVHKGRSLFFGDAAGQTLRLRQADELRVAASRLGHDIGQMRLPFNPRLYVAQPAYRDDNAFLWRAPSHAKPQWQEGGQGPDSRAAPQHGHAADAEAAPASARRCVYPEWDRLISRHRAGWCAVHERVAVATDDAAGRRWLATRPPMQPWSPACMPQPPAPARERVRGLEDGEGFDFDALLQARVAQRLGLPVDGRIHEALRLAPTQAVDLWLLDLSASASPQQMQGARDAARWAAEGACSRGDVCAIEGFRSCGRDAVHYELLKGFHEPLDAAVAGRLAALCGSLSTRLGAALRHATQRLLSARPIGARRLFVVTDGVPFDIDIHDPRYLLEDARHAVAEARREGLQVIGVALDAAAEAALRLIFGGGQLLRLQRAGGSAPEGLWRPQDGRVGGVRGGVSDGSVSSSLGGVASMR